MSTFCLIAVRNEARYLPGFLHNVRGHVDGILALDDCSTDGTAGILKREPRVISILREDQQGPPHANETKNRYRLLLEAARLNARWVLCADADERFEEAFLRRVPEEVERGERTGQDVRFVRIVNLWNSRSLYRVDGLCGPRWAPRMFKMPKEFTRRPFGLHRPWFPPELDHAPRAYMNAYLYHLKMIERHSRETRFEKFRSVDPNNEHQAIGYSHLIDETNLKLKPVLPWRQYTDLTDDESWIHAVRESAAGTAARSPVLPGRGEFDEEFYLNQYFDVQQAISQGEFTTGWQHFERHGAREGRQWKKPSLFGLDFGAIFNKWRDAKS